MGDNLIRRGGAGIAAVVLGPWPVYPGTIAVVATYGMLVRGTVRILNFAPETGTFTRMVLPNVATGILTVAVAVAGAVVVPRIAARIAPNRGVVGERVRYVATMLVVSAMLTAAITLGARVFFVDAFTTQVVPIWVITLTTVVVAIATVWSSNSFMGAVRDRLQRQEDVIAEQLELVRSDRSRQLAAEEQVRAEAARYLHDDVQSALLRAAMRLQPLLQADDAVTREAAERTVEEIDRVREDGVRTIGRRLSPPLSSTGLIVALRELADQYAGVVEVELAFDEAAAERFRMVRGDDRAALALYRLAEQALQNALKHGRAQTARIDVALVGTGASIVVTADGSPPVELPVAGEGTAIVNAWVDDLSGTWSLVAGTGGGSVFTAVIGVT